jgi:hypothetical protein
MLLVLLPLLLLTLLGILRVVIPTADTWGNPLDPTRASAIMGMRRDDIMDTLILDYRKGTPPVRRQITAYVFTDNHAEMTVDGPAGTFLTVTWKGKTSKFSKDKVPAANLAGVVAWEP